MPTPAQVGRVSAGRGRSPRCFHLGAPTPSARRLGGRGRPWPERQGGRADRATPEIAGLPGGSLTFKVTGCGETTGPRQSRGHRSSRNPTGDEGCAAPQESREDTIQDIVWRPPQVPTLPSIKGAQFYLALVRTLRDLGPGLLISTAYVCVCVCVGGASRGLWRL